MNGLTLERESLNFGGQYPSQQLWLLRGPSGVVQFKVGRHRAEAGASDSCRRYASISHFDADGNCWQAWDLGYHSPLPRYDGQEPITKGSDVCEVLQMEADCYYDGTTLGASNLLDHWLAADCSEDVLREELIGWYQRWLVDDGEAFASPVTALTVAIERSAR